MAVFACSVCFCRGKKIVESEKALVEVTQIEVQTILHISFASEKVFLVSLKERCEVCADLILVFVSEWMWILSLAMLARSLLARRTLWRVCLGNVVLSLNHINYSID